MKVLIVEDNQAVRRMMKSLIADLADEIRECADGAEALSAYSESQPDVVLMDIRMQQVDGLTATRIIKARHHDARIIIVTNHDQPELRDAAHDAGAAGYVLKENLMTLRQLLAECRSAETEKLNQSPTESSN